MGSGQKVKGYVCGPAGRAAWTGPQGQALLERREPEHEVCTLRMFEIHEFCMTQPSLPPDRLEVAGRVRFVPAADIWPLTIERLCLIWACSAVAAPTGAERHIRDPPNSACWYQNVERVLGSQ